MTKIDAQLKEAILKDKVSMSTKQLQEKYSLSRSSIQRIKLPDLESRAEEFTAAPTVNQAEAVRIVDHLVKETQPLPQPQLQLQPQTAPREDTIQRIILNLETFPAHFGIQDKTAFIQGLSSKSAFELSDILKTMEYTRATNNLSAQMKQVFFLASRATETLGPRLRLKTQGLTEALLQQQQELQLLFW
jgi:hypothetical protein